MTNMDTTSLKNNNYYPSQDTNLKNFNRSPHNETEQPIPSSASLLLSSNQIQQQQQENLKTPTAAAATTTTAAADKFNNNNNLNFFTPQGISDNEKERLPPPNVVYHDYKKNTQTSLNDNKRMLGHESTITTTTTPHYEKKHYVYPSSDPSTILTDTSDVLNPSPHFKQQQQHIQSIKLDEKTELLPSSQQHFMKPISSASLQRGSIPKYRTDRRDYLSSNFKNTLTSNRLLRFVGFWATIIAFCLSLPLIVYSIFILLVSKTSTTPDLVVSILGIFLGLISVLAETAHLGAYCCCPWLPQWKIGHHLLLHTIIFSFCILPFSQGSLVFGLLFLLHIIPAGLFYIARIRRESIHVITERATAAVVNI